MSGYSMKNSKWSRLYIYIQGIASQGHLSIGHPTTLKVHMIKHKFIPHKLHANVIVIIQLETSEVLLAQKYVKRLRFLMTWWYVQHFKQANEMQTTVTI
jgi:alcohol dehydrogenase YqhD (iron-dependent ADH family)